MKITLPIVTKDELGKDGKRIFVYEERAMEADFSLGSEVSGACGTVFRYGLCSACRKDAERCCKSFVQAEMYLLLFGNGHELS